MKQRRISLLLICAALLIAVLCALPTGAWAAAESQNAKASPPRPPYIFSVDEITGGTGFSASSKLYVYEDYTLPDGQSLTLKGWLATDEGVSGYEYAWVSDMHRTPEWIKVQEPQIVPRGDLKHAGIPYEAGHETAGFSITVPPLAQMEDGYYDLYIRAVSGDGTGLDIVMFNRVRYGDPDVDDGEKRIVSFSRLAKTPGALKDAIVSESGLTLTNTSFAALGQLNLAAFERIRITYSVSTAYTDGKQALLGFKSSAEHPYGNGQDAYNLTHHVTALPLHTQTTDMQTAELNLENLQLPPHDALYLSTCLKDGVSVTLHSLELTYRGQGYDRTAAKLYFSSDIISKFAGANHVELQGINDPVMGDVLRIEVKEETNDPYARFNASSLFDDHDLRLSADDYPYMVVLARANPQNLHASMTFYLCAGTIYGATEACTYTHSLIKDGNWHYYVFDLTSKENWKGSIHGWRFDIISGESLPGNYVDFASIQFFATKEAAQKAASASISTGITPHQLGMPALQRHDDIENIVLNDAPAVFEDGDWFVIEEETEPVTEPITEPETESETESETEPETEPIPVTESDTKQEMQTPPDETSETVAITQETTEILSSTAADILPETESTATGCASTVSAVSLILCLPLIWIIKNKKSKTKDL